MNYVEKVMVWLDFFSLDDQYSGRTVLIPASLSARSHPNGGALLENQCFKNKSRNNRSIEVKFGSC